MIKLRELSEHYLIIISIKKYWQQILTPIYFALGFDISVIYCFYMVLLPPPINAIPRGGGGLADADPSNCKMKNIENMLSKSLLNRMYLSPGYAINVFYCILVSIHVYLFKTRLNEFYGINT